MAMMEHSIDPNLSYVYEVEDIVVKPLTILPKFQLDDKKSCIITIYEDTIQMINYLNGKIVCSIDDRVDNGLNTKIEDDDINDNAFVTEVYNNFVVGTNRNLLITVSSDKMILKQWDLTSKKCIHVWKSTHKRLISSMAIDVTDSLLATGSSDKSIKVWDLNKRFYTHNLKTVLGLVNLLKFHSTPDHIWLISCHDDCNIRIWDLHARSCIVQFESHTSAISSLDFYSDGITMVSFGKDSRINFWDIVALTHKNTMNYHGGEIEFGSLVPPTVVKQLQLDVSKAHALICGSSGSLLQIIQLDPLNVCVSVDIGNGSLSNFGLKYCQWVDLYQCTCIVVTSDLDFLTINLLNKSITHQFSANLNEVLDIKYINDDGGRIALASTVENIKIYSINDDSTLTCQQLLYGHAETVLSLDCTHDGSVLVSGSKDNTIRVWKLNPETKKYNAIAVGTSHMHSVNCVAISKQTPYFILSGSEDFTVKKWLLSSCINDGKISPEWTSHGHSKGVNCCAIAPNNQIIATASNDKLIIIWNMKGKQLCQLTGHRRPVNTIVFSARDQILVSGSTDCNLMIWSMANYTCLKTLEGHTSSITSVKLFNDYSQIMSSSSDGLLKVWSLESYKCLNTLDGHNDKLWCFDVNDQMKSIISGDASGIVVLWKDKTRVKYEEKQNEKIKNVENEQNLQNLIHQGNSTDAIGYAIQLNKSRQVYTLFQNIINPCTSVDESIQVVKEIIQTFDIDQINFLAKMVNEWNTHSKYFIVAQIILKSLVELTSLDTLQSALNIDSLISYSDRHLKRINKHHEDSYLYGLLATYRKHGIASNSTQP